MHQLLISILVITVSGCVTPDAQTISITESLKLECKENRVLPDLNLGVVSCNMSNFGFDTVKVEVSSITPQDPSTSLASPKQIQTALKQLNQSENKLSKAALGLAFMIAATSDTSALAQPASAIVVQNALQLEQSTSYFGNHILNDVIVVDHMKTESRSFALMVPHPPKNQQVSLCFNSPNKECKKISIKWKPQESNAKGRFNRPSSP